MRVLVIGDGFIPTSAYAEALVSRVDSTIVVDEVEWKGQKADHHAAQALMEQVGPTAVPTPPELLAAVADAEALALHFAPVSAGLIAAAPELKLIAVARTGLENVDVAAATARGIAVAPVYGRNASAVAELQIGLMLAEARNIARADASVKAGGWRKDFPGAFIEITSRTIGMVGFGHVGRQLARKLSGFTPRLLAYDPYASDELLEEYAVERARTLEQVFAQSAFVTVLARLTPETERFITAKHFALMQPSAYFINGSRSRLVDYDALYAALAAGAISGAGLDVFDSEPLADGDKWRALDNVTITTHFGGDTVDTNLTSAALVADVIAEFASTGQVATAVNATGRGW